MFFVQTAVHADRGSRHETAEEALEAIEEMIHAGVAEPGEFDVREVDAGGRTIRVFGLKPERGDADLTAG